MHGLFYVLMLVTAYTVTGDGDPCEDHVIVHEEYRRSTGYVRPIGEDPLCDRFIAFSAWYRFTGRQGTDMPTQPPELNRCGTSYPIWINGNLPTNNEQVVAIACVLTPVDDCQKQYMINIKNCGNFNVYNLKRTTGCNEAYCVGTEVPCPANHSSQTGYTPGCIDGNLPFLTSDPVITAGVANFGAKWDEIKMSCNIVHNNNDIVYDVKWYIDDVLVHEQSSVTDVPFTIKEDKLRLNAVLKCSVYPKYAGSDLIGLHREATYFMGFNVSTLYFHLVEGGDPLSYELRPTVPILCAKGYEPPACVLHVLLKKPINTDDGSPAVCGNLDPVNQIQYQTSSCGIELSATTDLSTVYQIKMIATDDTIYEETQTVIANFGTENEVAISSLWANYVLPPATVTVVDSALPIKNKFCSAANDPHMRTFDGRRYEHQYEGEFILYRNKRLPIEVQAYFRRCNSVATCVCGAAIRSGGDVFIYEFCRRNFPSRIKLYHCKTGGMKIIRQNYGYEVILPTSTRVVLKRSQIVIYPSSSDYGNTDGLCGTLTNNCTDDFLTSGGEYNPSDGKQCSSSWKFYARDFSLSWRVPAGRSLYKGQDPGDPEPADVQYCTCSRNENAKIDETVCGTMGKTAPACAPKDQIDEQTRRCLSRKKRSLDNLLDDDVEEEIELFEYDPTFVAPIPEWRDGWTEESARQECINYIQEKPGTQACMTEGVGKVQEAIDSCVEDIQITANTTYSIVHLDSVLSLCQDEIIRNMSYYSFVTNTSGNAANETKVIQTPAFILKDVCPADCSQQGVCNEGKCTCNEGFTGPDCSEEEGKIPDLYDIPFKGLCDKQQRQCALTPVTGDYFIESEYLMCKVTPAKVMLDTSITSVEETVTEADFDHSQRLFCPLPPVEKELDEAVVAVKYSIAISNDGERFSGEKHVFTYDSKCVTCSQTDNCVLKPNTCLHQSTCYEDGESLDATMFCLMCNGATGEMVQDMTTCYIDGQCYLPGEASTYQPCAKCDPQVSTNDWTEGDNCVSAGQTMITPTLVTIFAALLITVLNTQYRIFI